MGKSTESNLSFQFDSSFVERRKDMPVSFSTQAKRRMSSNEKKKTCAVPFAALYPFASFGSELR